MATRVLTPTGAGAHTGADEANAMTYAEALAVAASGDVLYFKGGTGSHTITAVWPANFALTLKGYTTSFTDAGYADVTISPTSGTAFIPNGAKFICEQLNFTASGGTTKFCYSHSNVQSRIERCSFTGFTGQWIIERIDSQRVSDCSFLNNTASAGHCLLTRCVISNTGSPTAFGMADFVCKGCPTAAASTAFSINLNRGIVYNALGTSDIYYPGAVVFTAGNATIRCENVIFWGDPGLSGAYITARDAGDEIELVRCAFGPGVDRAFAGTNCREIDCITLTADPFVNAASNDFRLNDAAGGGALLKAMQWAMPSLSSTVVKPWHAWAQSTSGGGGGTTIVRRPALSGGFRQ